MWSSINQIEHAPDLKTAYAFSEGEACSVLGGGSYLVAERPATVATLVPVQHLLSSSLSEKDGELQISAGVTLQEMVDRLAGPLSSRIAACARSSCASLNIRNQRTIGGEIARNRPNSDLMVCLCALNPELLVQRRTQGRIRMADWNGKGIILSISIELKAIQKLIVKRYARLESAPAFVIVASASRADQWRLALGGASERIVSETFESSSPPKEDLGNFLNTAARGFKDDQFGSVEYKMHLIRESLKLES